MVMYNSETIFIKWYQWLKIILNSNLYTSWLGWLNVTLVHFTILNSLKPKYVKKFNLTGCDVFPLIHAMSISLLIIRAAICIFDETVSSFTQGCFEVLQLTLLLLPHSSLVKECLKLSYYRNYCLQSGSKHFWHSLKP